MERGSTRRTDGQLLAMMDEICGWRIIGSHGRELGVVGTLGEAINESARISTAKRVVALAPCPAEDIIVFEDQTERPRALTAARTGA